MMLFGVILGISCPRGWSMELEADQLTFTYQNASGKPRYECWHEVENRRSHDWLVKCGPSQKNIQKKYSVHLLVNTYLNHQKPEMSHEVLFWVTDRSDSEKKVRPFSGTTTTFRFEKQSPLYQIHMNQSVENDLARLNVTMQFIKEKKESKQ